MSQKLVKKKTKTKQDEKIKPLQNKTVVVVVN